MVVTRVLASGQFPAGSRLIPSAYRCSMGMREQQGLRYNLLNQRVAFITDPTQDTTGRYGRTLAYLVKEDGWNYSVEAARAGTAKAYIYDNKPVQKYAEIAAAEQEAKTADRGLWGPPCNGDTESTPLSALKSAPGTPAPGASVYYPNCKAARAAGAAPLHVGQPGYRSGLDGDGDGVACEG